MVELNRDEMEKVEKFAHLARQYCEMLEKDNTSSAEDFLKRAAWLFSALYNAALDLPLAFPDSDDLIKDTVSGEESAKICRKPLKKLEHDFYWHTFEPFNEKEEPVFGGSLFDDFFDIYHDIKNALNVYENGNLEEQMEAAWDWKFNFEHHWGNHLTGALYGLHCILQEKVFH